MIYLRVFATTALLSLAGAALIATQAPARGGSGFSHERLERVNAFVQGHVDSRQLPGAVLLLARGGEVAVLKAFGSANLQDGQPMRTDSLFRLASASKIVTTVALLSLYEEGRFALGDPVSKYIPEFARLGVRLADGSVRPASRPLTIRDLLRHTTGYGYGSEPRQRESYWRAGLMPNGTDDDWSHELSLAAWASALAAVPLDSEPGARFEYGLGHDLAGALIERIAGEPLDEFMRSRIFQPLKMHDTGFTVPPSHAPRLTSLHRVVGDSFEIVDEGRTSRFLRRPDALSGGGGWDMAGYGGLVTSASDFFRFLQMLLDRGALGGTRVLSRQSVEMMFSNQLQGLEVPERTPGVGFGFGYAIVVDAVRYGEVGAPGLMWWAGSANTRYWLDPGTQTIGLYLTQVLPFPYLDLMGAVMRLGIQAVE
jgi:CubicO group peptidase (beta-lactamase class C family)